MRGERGQASVEWTGVLLLVALVLVGVGQLAGRADGSELGSSLARSVTNVPRAAERPARPPLHLASRPPVLPPPPRPGALWRKAWFACLVYERIRYGLRHPESRLPGYTFPYGVALRIAGHCIRPADLLHDVPALDPGP